MSSSPRIIVGTHVWNQKEAVLNCLASLMALDDSPRQIIVVDNASTDGAFEAIQSRYPAVQIVTHPQNLGSAEGVNALIRHAIQERSDYLFVVDPAGTVEPEALRKLIRLLEENPRLGAVSPSVQDAEKPGRVCFDENVTGRFCLLRMEAVKHVGFFDPYYFVHFEDEDWFLRLQNAGYSTQVAPQAKVRFRPSQAVGFEATDFRYYRTRNGLTFLKKYGQRGAFSFFLEQGFSKLSLLGLWDFLRQKRGRRNFERREEQKSSLQETGMKNNLLVRIARSVRFHLKQALGRPLSIRVYVNWNIGDELIASPAYLALKEKYPKAVLSAHVRYPELLKGNPYVDFINTNGEREDLLIDLHREIRNEPRMRCVPRFAGVSTWSEPRVYLAEEEKRAARKKWGVDDKMLAVAVCPESQWFSRRWEREKWIELVDYFLNHSARVFVLGKEGESLPRGIDLVGKTSLREAAALLSQCRLFVSSDSGPLHLALAVGTPSVGLFGPLNPDFLMARRSSFIPVWSEVECRGCWSDARMKYRDHCPKIVPDCMTSISVPRVIQACETLLSGVTQKISASTRQDP